MKPKTIVILLFAVLAFLAGVAAQYFWPGSVQSPADACYVIFASMLIFTWYRIDSRQRSYKRSPWLNISIFALALVAFPYYLFRSRGLKRGVIATVLFFVGTLAAGTISVAGQYAVWYVLQS